jgi:hypothetical protein
VISRREFIKNTALAAAGTVLGASAISPAPEILTRSRTRLNTQKGDLIFRPYFVQSGRGPHLGLVKSIDTLGESDWDFPCWAFTSDEQWDAFQSNIYSDSAEGVKVSDVQDKEHFGINVRWNVEGFGYIYMTADNGGEFYSLPAMGKSRTLNLNYELAKSRAARVRKRLAEFRKEGFEPSRELEPFLELSEEFIFEAEKAIRDNEKCARLAQKSLYYSMWAGEKMEVEKARNDIESRQPRRDFFFGCDTKGYPHMDKEVFLELFTNVFNYATITHYLPSFEKEEGRYIFENRDEQFKELKKKNVTVEGRPVFWADECCTPEWLSKKSYPELLKYVENHTRALLSHYGSEMYAWEIINEAHDPGNVLHLNPDQMVEIAKIGCEVAKSVNPRVHRLINNCCIQADYIQLKKWEKGEKRYPPVTPHQYLKMLYEADVDFTITGQQLYYPYTNRDLMDTILLTERIKKFGRPVQITELGASSGPSVETITSGKMDIPRRPYDWHRPWDEELQADWLEEIYTILYSKPWIEAVNWYDFVDPYSFIKNGGLLSSPKGEVKPAYERLESLKMKWKLVRS